MKKETERNVIANAPALCGEAGTGPGQGDETMQFTDAELDTIIHCLDVSAEWFDEDVRMIAASSNTHESNRRLILMFEEQARQARALREKIDNR